MSKATTIVLGTLGVSITLALVLVVVLAMG